VAFITGVARGQGRAHALRLAAEGISIIGIDVCEDTTAADYPVATEADLAETVRLVEQAGGTILATKADVRDFSQQKAAFDAGFQEFGRIDIVIANAGIIRLADEIDPVAEFDDIIATNLSGAWKTVRVALPAMIEAGNGGSIVLVSSAAGIKGGGSPLAGMQAYTAAKRGLVGLMQVLANDLAEHWIRVNTIHPTGVATPMVLNEAMRRAVERRRDGVATMRNALPIGLLDVDDVANTVAWLVSDEARSITGVALPIDAGFTVR
jgi:SDR family mycofactocin-dependent oxidoreductase